MTERRTSINENFYKRGIKAMKMTRYITIALLTSLLCNHGTSWAMKKLKQAQKSGRVTSQKVGRLRQLPTPLESEMAAEAPRIIKTGPQVRRQKEQPRIPKMQVKIPKKRVRRQTITLESPSPEDEMQPKSTFRKPRQRKKRKVRKKTVAPPVTPGVFARWFGYGAKPQPLPEEEKKEVPPVTPGVFARWFGYGAKPEPEPEPLQEEESEPEEKELPFREMRQPERLPEPEVGVFEVLPPERGLFEEQLEEMQETTLPELQKKHNEIKKWISQLGEEYTTPEERENFERQLKQRYHTLAASIAQPFMEEWKAIKKRAQEIMQAALHANFAEITAFHNEIRGIRDTKGLIEEYNDALKHIQLIPQETTLFTQAKNLNPQSFLEQALEALRKRREKINEQNRKYFREWQNKLTAIRSSKTIQELNQNYLQAGNFGKTAVASQLLSPDNTETISTKRLNKVYEQRARSLFNPLLIQLEKDTNEFDTLKQEAEDLGTTDADQKKAREITETLRSMHNAAKPAQEDLRSLTKGTGDFYVKAVTIYTKWLESIKAARDAAEEKQ